MASCSALISSTNVWTSSLLRGSRPVVGSSSRSSVGLVSRARAIATFCCIPRLICSTGRPSRLSAMPSRSRITIASRRAWPAIDAVQAGREQEVLHRAELLEERGVHADTRLMSRFTAISSRSMSWPNTSTRPSSSVSRPDTSRMSVDLPEPLAPRIPSVPPRSRRSETFVDRDHRRLSPGRR